MNIDGMRFKRTHYLHDTCSVRSCPSKYFRNESFGMCDIENLAIIIEMVLGKMAHNSTTFSPTRSDNILTDVLLRTDSGRLPEWRAADDTPSLLRHQPRGEEEDHWRHIHEGRRECGL